MTTFPDDFSRVNSPRPGRNLAPVDLYANAFHIDAGQCFRLVYEQRTTRPMFCPARWSLEDGGRTASAIGGP